MYARFCCSKFISLALAMLGDSVFIMRMVYYYKIFINPGGEKTEYKSAKYNNNWKIYLKTYKPSNNSKHNMPFFMELGN